MTSWQASEIISVVCFFF